MYTDADAAGTGRAVPRAPRPRDRSRRWHDVDPDRRGMVLGWVAFTVTFLIARLVTGVIKIFGKDSGNVNAGSLHLHHFLWGILLVVAVACFGMTDRGARERSWMGIGLGIGLALIVDEVALLVTLRDVYWQSSGWTSVGAAIVIIGLLGSALAFTRSAKYEARDPD